MANKQIPPTPVRLPDDLKSWVKQRARSNHRSVNGEIITILSNEKQQEIGQEYVLGQGRTDLLAGS